MYFLCLVFLIDPELIYKELCFSAILRNNPLNIISEYGFIRNNEGGKLKVLSHSLLALIICHDNLLHSSFQQYTLNLNTTVNKIRRILKLSRYVLLFPGISYIMHINQFGGLYL